MRNHLTSSPRVIYLLGSRPKFLRHCQCIISQPVENSTDSDHLTKALKHIGPGNLLK